MKAVIRSGVGAKCAALAKLPGVVRHFNDPTMKGKKYKILLDGKLFGTTKLEFGDPPMGVVFGQNCIDNSIKIQTDYPNDKLISTEQIVKLKVYNSEHIELVGELGNNIEGMDSDSFTITILGLDSEVYEREFPEHISEYEQKFKN